MSGRRFRRLVISLPSRRAHTEVEARLGALDELVVHDSRLQRERRALWRRGRGRARFEGHYIVEFLGEGPVLETSPGYRGVSVDDAAMLVRELGARVLEVPRASVRFSARSHEQRMSEQLQTSLQRLAPAGEVVLHTRAEDYPPDSSLGDYGLRGAAIGPPGAIADIRSMLSESRHVDAWNLRVRWH